MHAMSKHSNAEKLRREIGRSAALSFQEAEQRLPDLAMAEAAGQDVSAEFADVLEALGRYPQLADAYELLLEDLEALLDDSAAAEPAARNPWLAATPARLTDAYALRMVDRQPQRFVVQCRQPASPPAMRLRGDLELMHAVVPELAGQPELRVSLRRQADERWQLVVAISALDGSHPWRITALVDELELAAADDQASGERRFQPLFAYPQTPIVLFFDGPEGGAAD